MTKTSTTKTAQVLEDAFAANMTVRGMAEGVHFGPFTDADDARKWQKKHENARLFCSLERDRKPVHFLRMERGMWQSIEPLISPPLVMQDASSYLIPVLGLEAVFPLVNGARLPLGLIAAREHQFDTDDIKKIRLAAEVDASVNLYDLFKAIKEVSKHWPCPQGRNFVSDETGVYLRTEDSEITVSTTSFWIEGHGKMLASGDSAIVLNFFDENNGAHQLVVPKGLALDQKAMLGRMLPLGFGWLGTKNLVNALADQRSATRNLPTIPVADKVGWLRHEDQLLYCTGSSVIAPTGRTFDAIPLDGLRAHLRQSGSLDGWQNSVFRLVQGNPIPLAIMCMALAGMLVDAMKIDTGFVHLVGKNGTGKTLMQQVAASLFGCGAAPGDRGIDGSDSFILRHHASANGLEAIAAQCGDLPIILDESGNAAHSEMGEVIYSLASGMGKVTMTSDRSLRTPGRWQTVIISSGEKSLLDAILESPNPDLKGGQLDRAADLHLPPDGVFTAWNGHDSFVPFAHELKQACKTHFGAPAQYLIQYLVDNPALFEELPALVAEVEESLRPEGIDNGARRVVRRFAAGAVAGQLAMRAGVFPENFGEEELESAFRSIVDLWHAGRQDPVRRIAEYCREYAGRVKTKFSRACTSPLYVFRSTKANLFCPVVAIPIDDFHEYFGDEGHLLLKVLAETGKLVREQPGRHPHRFGNNELRAFAFRLDAVLDSLGNDQGILPTPS